MYSSHRREKNERNGGETEMEPNWRDGKGSILYMDSIRSLLMVTEHKERK